MALRVITVAVVRIILTLRIIVVRGQVCVANLLKESGGEAQRVRDLRRVCCWMHASSVQLAVS